MKKILELDSNKWFEQKNTLLKTFSEDIVVRSWELAPGDGVAVPNKFFKDERVFGALVFAKYFNDGDYKARTDLASVDPVKRGPHGQLDFTIFLRHECVPPEHPDSPR